VGSGERGIGEIVGHLPPSDGQSLGSWVDIWKWDWLRLFAGIEQVVDGTQQAGLSRINSRKSQKIIQKQTCFFCTGREYGRADAALCFALPVVFRTALILSQPAK
jgi:hypothetical protein